MMMLRGDDVRHTVVLLYILHTHTLFLSNSGSSIDVMLVVVGCMCVLSLLLLMLLLLSVVVACMYNDVQLTTNNNETQISHTRLM